MKSIVHLNGQYCEAKDAHLSIFDRGVLFGDSVYELIPVYEGMPFFVDRHLNRLKSSLDKARIKSPKVDWRSVFAELIKQNGSGDLQLYLQITRGNQGVRKHDIPQNLEPTFFAFTLHTPYPSFQDKQHGLHAYIENDFRWLHCDIKSNSMLANILINDNATSAGAHTAILSRNGLLTEGNASNVFIVDVDDVIKTPPLDDFCLPGITRQITIELIKELGLPIKEEVIPIVNLFSAKEIWITSTTKEIYPVTCLNFHPIGNGSGGVYWEQLNEKYHQLTRKNAYD